MKTINIDGKEYVLKADVDKELEKAKQKEVNEMDLIELMKEEYLIEERDGKYYCDCCMNEEITIELNNIISKLKTSGLEE